MRRTICLLLLLAPLAAVAQRPPHVPTEEELRRRLGEKQPEPTRTYQADSVEGLGQKAQRAASWVKDRLSGLHITPARLLIGLGILGILYAWNKNKKKTHWAVINVISFLLVVGGVVAMIFRWPNMN